MSRTARIFRNFGFLTLGKIFGESATFILVVTVSRVFGQEGIGLYSFAMGLTGIFAVISEFGLYNLTVKHVAQRPEQTREYAGKLLVLRILLGVAATLALLAVLPFLPLDREGLLVVCWIGIYQILHSILLGLSAIAVAHEEMQVASGLELSLKIAAATATLGLIVAGAPLVVALAAMPAMGLVFLVVSSVTISRRYGKPLRPETWAATGGLLREAVPYGIFRLLVIISIRTDVVMLGLLMGTVAAGLFNVSYRVAFLLIWVAYYVGLSVLPVASKMFLEDHDELKALYHRSLRWMILGSIPASAGLMVIAPELIPLVFGPGFEQSIGVLQIVAWLVFFYSLKGIMGVFLTACDRQPARARNQAIAAVFNIVGNLALIPVLGLYGAALVTVVSDLLLACLFSWQLRDIVGLPRVASRLLIGGIGAAAFVVPLTLYPLPMVAAIPVAAAIYVAVLLLFPAIRRDELGLVLKQLGLRRAQESAAR